MTQGKIGLTLAIAVFGCSAWAADAQAPKEVKAERINYESAAAIDFGKELKLPFEALSSLGYRIEQSRRAADPVGLASSATELAVAEKVSGKKTSLTADSLWKEALELAKLRNRSLELKALRLMTSDGATGKSLDELADKAAKIEADEAAASRSGERSRGVRNVLLVQNAFDHPFHIIVNGTHRGIVPPFADGQFFIGHGPTTNTVMEARSPWHNFRYIVFDNPVNFNWRLDPNVP